MLFILSQRTVTAASELSNVQSSISAPACVIWAQRLNVQASNVAFESNTRVFISVNVQLVMVTEQSAFITKLPGDSCAASSAAILIPVHVTEVDAWLNSKLLKEA